MFAGPGGRGGGAGAASLATAKNSAAESEKGSLSELTNIPRTKICVFENTTRSKFMLVMGSGSWLVGQRSIYMRNTARRQPSPQRSSRSANQSMFYVILISEYSSIPLLDLTRLSFTYVVLVLLTRTLNN